MSSARGLTLLEVLVALGISALALVIALPMISSGPTHIEVQAVADAVAGSLRDARSAAIASNRPVDFHIDLARRVYGYGRGKAAGRVDPAIRLTLYTTDDQRIGANAGAIRFFPDGGSTGGGVALALADGKQRTMVGVDWFSGDVSITEDMSEARP